MAAPKPSVSPYNSKETLILALIHAQSILEEWTVITALSERKYFSFILVDERFQLRTLDDSQMPTVLKVSCRRRLVRRGSTNWTLLGTWR